MGEENVVSAAEYDRQHEMAEYLRSEGWQVEEPEGLTTYGLAPAASDCESRRDDSA